MKDFFNSLKFKILVSICVLLVGFMLFAASSDEFGNVSSGILGTITSPFQSVSSYISKSVGDFIGRFVNADKIEKENKELKEEVARLIKQAVDYQELLEQNEQLREMLKIQDMNPDYETEMASVISRDPNEMFGSFTINKGSMHGIKKNDPVISSQGLVGKILRVGPISSKVIPITSPELKVSCFEIRTRSVGILTGDAVLFQDGLCKVENLERDVSISAGNIIVTAGISGMFPQEVPIGTVKEVGTSSNGMSSYAIIQPAADVNMVKDVVVIKKFEGQGEDIMFEEE